MRKKVILVCEVCLSRNYRTQVAEYSKDRFTINKFCAKCNQHTQHKETR